MGAKWIKTSLGLTWQMAQLSELHNQLPYVFYMVIREAGEQCQTATQVLPCSSVGVTQPGYESTFILWFFLVNIIILIHLDIILLALKTLSFGNKGMMVLLRWIQILLFFQFRDSVDYCYALSISLRTKTVSFEYRIFPTVSDNIFYVSLSRTQLLLIPEKFSAPLNWMWINTKCKPFVHILASRQKNHGIFYRPFWSYWCATYRWWTTVSALLSPYTSYRLRVGGKAGQV